MYKKQIQKLRFIVQIISVIFFTQLFALTFQSFKNFYLSFLNKGNKINIYSSSFLLFIVLITLVLILGRFFCGWLCAFGAINDFIYFGSRKIFKKKFEINKKVDSRLKYIKYILLFSIILLSLTINVSFLNKYSPWNAFANVLNSTSTFREMPIAFLILLAVLGGSIFVERFFCRYLCPLGALQGLISKFKISSIKKDTKLCGNCNLCSYNCPMKIDSNKKESVKSNECIECLRCISNCPKDNSYKAILNKKIKLLIYVVIGLVIFYVPYYIGDKTYSRKVYNRNTNQQYNKIQKEDKKNKSIEKKVSNKKNSVKEENKKYNDGVYEGVSKSLKASVTIQNDKITNINIISHREEKGFFEEAFRKIPEQFISTQKTEVDVVSGATNTSKRLINAIKNAIEKAKKTK